MPPFAVIAPVNVDVPVCRKKEEEKKERKKERKKNEILAKTQTSQKEKHILNV